MSYDSKTREELIDEIARLKDRIARMGTYGITSSLSVDGMEDMHAVFRKLHESSRDAVMLYDGSAIIECNGSAMELFGRGRDGLVGKDLVEFSPRLQPSGEESENLSKKLMMISFIKGFNHFEWLYQRPDGTKFHADVFLHSFAVEGKKMLELVVTDVTDQKRAEELASSLGRILEGSINEIYIFDADTFRFMDVNLGARRNLGYTMEELRGLTMFDVQREYSAKDFLVAARSLKDGKVDKVIIETTHRRKDGSAYPIEAHIQYTALGETPVFAEIVLDVTERKAAERKIAQEADIARNLFLISEATAHTTDIEKLLRDVVTCSREIGCGDVVLSYIWDVETRRFRPIEGSGFEPGLTPLFKTESIDTSPMAIKEAFSDGRVAFVDMRDQLDRKRINDGSYFGWIKNATATAVIPLMAKRAYLGLMASVCLCAEPFSEHGCFSGKKKSLLQTIRNTVSTALEEARLYKDSVNASMHLSRKVETIQIMSEMGKSILSTHESKVILETTIRMISKLISCDWVRVIVVDKEKQELRFLVGMDEDTASLNTTVSYDSTVLTEVVEHGRVQYIPDVTSLQRPLFIEKQLIDGGLMSVLRVPVVIKGEVVGVLGVMARRKAAFTQEDRETLEKLASHIGIALENSRLLTDLEELFIGTVKTLAGTIEAKSYWTRGHSDRVTKLAMSIGKTLGLGADELKNLELAGLLHDIGKIGTYESILDKPGKLTAEEVEIIRKHPGKGAEMLSSIKLLKDIVPGVKHHHEFYDGSGYPDRLSGDDIPLIARILAVADTVDAMGADRPYRKGKSTPEIRTELIRCSGTQFDPVAVDAFLKMPQEELDAVSGL
jgi:PAS domain S-box-containing protein/putative nucleotidyltransferase with HDIG domain